MSAMPPVTGKELAAVQPGTPVHLGRPEWSPPGAVAHPTRRSRFATATGTALSLPRHADGGFASCRPRTKTPTQCKFAARPDIRSCRDKFATVPNRVRQRR